MQKGLFVALWLSAAIGCHAAETFTGTAKIKDGDSIEIGSTRIRLFGIDAPEGAQTCQDQAGASWRCGDAATAKLRELIGSSSVTCTRVDTDTYGRAVSVCKKGAMDLGAAMVSAGYALAYRHYSQDYVRNEDEARIAKLGLWKGEFDKPWDYRNGSSAPESPPSTSQRSTDVPSSRKAGCHIKGNINDRGDHIYHVPDSASYAATKIDEAKGERWFCTEEEAKRAGWRAPKSSR